MPLAQAALVHQASLVATATAADPAPAAAGAAEHAARSPPTLHHYLSAPLPSCCQARHAMP